MIYLNTYRPLIGSPAGVSAIEQYGLPSYVDDSCRREPDLESKYPSITALCRFKVFAPRLKLGDTVVYMTKMGKYPGHESRHWRLTAVLRVTQRFASHADAGSWYRKQKLPLPRNCMADGNEPLPLEMTARRVASVKAWDRKYRQRSEECGVFLACEPVYVELEKPPIVTREMLVGVFGKVPYTMNPPAISQEQLDGLTRVAGVSIG